MKTCVYCWTLITEANEILECIFGTDCSLCDVCHRLVEREAAAEAQMSHEEFLWARRKSNAALSV